MLKTKNYQFWFCTGSQDLYGDECLAHVAEHSKIIVDALNKSGNLPYEVVWKPTMITNEVIRRTFNEANTDENCAGVITWCHTFSPAKSWILGLKELRKPLLHLHTQFNREIPYDTIDMDFMNENQAAHGDREFGHIFTRLHKNRKVIMGYWEDKETQERIGDWMRTAVGVVEKIISFLFLVPSSMLSAISAICAQCVGTKQHQRARQTLRYGMIIALGFGIFFAITCQFISKEILSLFTSEAIVIMYGSQYLKGYVLDCMFASIHFCFSGFFTAYGYSMISFIHNVISIVLIRVPGAYITSKLFPDTLLPMGLTPALGSILSAIICVSIFIIMKKKNKFDY